MHLSGIFANRYFLLKDPREGGTATVYKAIDSMADETPVAVKVFKNASVEDRFLQQMFYNEVESLSRLKHSNIVQLLDSGIDQTTNSYYIVLEWIESSLAQWRQIYRQDINWPSLASKIVLPVLDALAIAHARGVRHRDIKPTNILLSSDGTPKIADFGIAKIVDSLRFGVTVNQFGARPYMPPEYWRSEVPIASPEGDLYSLGITILKVLESKEYPISHDFLPGPETVKSAIQHIKLDRQTIEFLIKLIHPNPTKRFFNAKVAYEELKSLLKLNTVQETSHLTFYLVLTNKTRELLRSSHNLRTDQEIQEFFYNDLGDEPAIRIDKRSPLTEPSFDLYGQELLYRLIVPSSEPYKLLITSAKAHPSSDAFIKWRDRAMPIAARWMFTVPANKTTASRDIEVLTERTQAHDESREREAIAVEEQEMYTKWRGSIRARRELITGGSYGFTYSSWSRKGSHLVFQSREALQDSLLTEEVIWRVAVERTYVQLKILDVVGTEILCAIVHGKLESIPRSGRIEIDTSASIIPLDRQERALNDVQNRTSRRTDLGKLLAWPSEVRPPVEIGELEVKTDDLDEAKLNALKMALGSEDVIIVQGPPGTGKTTWIAELVYQELKRTPGKKILLSAQTHIAVDNALEQILKLRPRTRAIRIGDSKNIADSVASYELSYRLTEWSMEVKNASIQHMNSLRATIDRKVPGALLLDWLRELSQVETQYQNVISEMGDLHKEKDRAAQTESRTAQSEFTFLKKVRELETIADKSKRMSDDLRLAIAETLDDIQVLSVPLNDVATKVLSWRDKLPMDLRQEVERFSRISKLQADWVLRFGNGEGFEDHLLSLADIVAGTCIGIERAFRSSALEIGFGLVVIDEASKASPTETLVPMSRGDKFVFVGDQKQLPPYVDQELLSHAILARHNLSAADIRETLFDRLSQQLPRTCQALLDTQYRMVPEIGGLISTCFYDRSLKTGRMSSDRIWLQNFLKKPVVWFSTSTLEHKLETRDGNSYRNLEECRRIAEWLRTLDDLALANQSRLSVGVIAGYSAQVQLLGEELGAVTRESLTGVTPWQSMDVTVNTVDTIQGREVDIVVYSITRSNRMGKIGHLRMHNRLNVALSRGKEGLIIFGDIEHCYAARENDNPFPRVIDYIRTNSDSCLEVIL